MTKPIIQIHDISTGEIINREMTDAEFTQHQIDIAKAQDEENREADKIAQRSAILERLGITVEEAKLLLG